MTSNFNGRYCYRTAISVAATTLTVVAYLSMIMIWITSLILILQLLQLNGGGMRPNEYSVRDVT